MQTRNKKAGRRCVTESVRFMESYGTTHVARVHGCCTVTLPRTLLVDYVEHTPTKSYHGICVSDMGRSMNVWHSEHTNTFLAQNKTPEQQTWCTRFKLV